MKFLLDTSIIIGFLKNDSLFRLYKRKLDLANKNMYISSVTKGEILALINRLGWSAKKMEVIFSVLADVISIDVEFENEPLHKVYADIDAFCRCKKVREHQLKKGVTMGKNDIWIAASAVSTDAVLVTMDKDFNHLNGVFLPVLYIEPPTDKFPKKK